MNQLKQTYALPVTALLVVIATAFATEPASAADVDAGKVARGKYLVTTSGCHDCHTPWHDGPSGPEPDMSRMLSGHPESLVITEPAALPNGPWIGATARTNTAFTGPWGVSFTANLTPDAETGLGKWTQATFMQAIRTGRHMGRGRKILPPMPFPMYRNFTDEDLVAIFTFLRTIPPMKNRVPEPLPPGATVTAAEK